MNISPDPSQHRLREGQIIQHVQKLLGDERLRVRTTAGKRNVTSLLRNVTRGDREIDLRRLMIEMNLADRELQNQMPRGEILEVSLSKTSWMFFTKTVGRIRVVCTSPTRALLASQTPKPMDAGEVTRLLEQMPPSIDGVPLTLVLVGTAGFTDDAHALATARPDRTVILLEPNEAGGWRAIAGPEARGIADLLDPEDDATKRLRVSRLIEENKTDLLTGGLSADKLAVAAQVPLDLVEEVAREYARQHAGIASKKLDGRLVLFPSGSGPVLDGASGGPMGLIDRMRTAFAGKGNNEKKIALLSERKAALNQQRERAFEEMSVLDRRERDLKEQFKESNSEHAKRRVTGQMLQLRKDLDRRQQLLRVLDQQINVVATALHNLELVRQGESAHLPDTNEIAEDAAKAEEVLAQLEADAELAGSVSGLGSTSMTDEEKEMYAELSRETADAPDVLEAMDPQPSSPIKAPPRIPDKPLREPPRIPAPPLRENKTSAAPAPSAPASSPRRAEPEAG